MPPVGGCAMSPRAPRSNGDGDRSARDAADNANEFVSETVAGAAESVRNGAHTVSDEAGRVAGDAIRRIEEEVGNRPLLTLAIAAGIGFLAGMAGRRH